VFNASVKLIARGIANAKGLVDIECVKSILETGLAIPGSSVQTIYKRPALGPEELSQVIATLS